MYRYRKNYLYNDELYVIGLDDNDCFVYRRLQWQPVDLDLIEEIKESGTQITFIQGFDWITEKFRGEAV